jgi:hypothetical protein
MIAFELTGEGQSRISSSLDGAPSGSSKKELRFPLERSVSENWIASVEFRWVETPAWNGDRKRSSTRQANIDPEQISQLLPAAGGFPEPLGWSDHSQGCLFLRAELGERGSKQEIPVVERLLEPFLWRV